MPILMRLSRVLLSPALTRRRSSTSHRRLLPSARQPNQFTPLASHSPCNYRVYKVFVSVTAFIIAAGFLIYGTRLIRLLGAMTQDVRSSLVKVRQT